MDISPDAREKKGLQLVFNSIFPIEEPSGLTTLEFINYSLEAPKYDVEECRQRTINYSAPLKVTLRLIVWDLDEEAGTKDIRGIKEQTVYMGDIPLMTDSATFIINGTERVVVSQMHRSPGVFYDHDKGKTHSSGKFLYQARIIPYRGSWLDFEFDGKDTLFFRIDRRRKLPITTLLKALHLNNQEIYDTFYDSDFLIKTEFGWSIKFNPEKFRGKKLSYDLIDASTGKVCVQTGVKLTARYIKELIFNGLETIIVQDDDILGSFVAQNIVHPNTNELILESGCELTKAALSVCDEFNVNTISLLAIDYINVGPYLRNTLFFDKNVTTEDALTDIYRVMRPGEPSTIEASTNLFNSLFFDEDRYDLSAVGRVKLNSRLSLSTPESVKVLTKQDIIEAIKLFILIKDGKGQVDDIDHLGNRRVRSVGELMENQFRLGLLRMQRTIIERMNGIEVDAAMPHDLVNAKVLVAVIREFFGSSQLSQFMDQTNPLSEITHKRRLSALGPGGLSRDRAGFEVRDVHPTHYGRICPIETPEGPNIGLINSLATYARVNKYGFIESPYRRVENKKILNEIIYLSAMEEGKYYIAPANSKIVTNGILNVEFVTCRKGDDFVMVPSHEVDFIDVSSKQLVSVAASLIPFLENDDANRALMGSNMQRQAVPLIIAEAPLIGTGMEEIVARDSGSAIVANRDGYVKQVDSLRIVITAENNDNSENSHLGVDVYNLLKFQRSNHNTCLNQKPLVKINDFVRKGDIIADGSSIDLGELALGRNVLVAFMAWKGCNFEDSIVISERIVREDVFTSIHIEEFETVARDTRLGPEDITRDIPNVGEEHLKYLDEVGIILVGAEVKPGDILVGKVTPKTESPSTPEEKLLRAIFGEKAGDVKDSSLRVPEGVVGIVTEVRVYLRRGVEKDERALAIERKEIIKLNKEKEDQLTIVEEDIYNKLQSILLNKQSTQGPKGFENGTLITLDILNSMSRKSWWKFVLPENDFVEKLKNDWENYREKVVKRYTIKVEKLQGGDDLPQGALKVVKVFIALKHKLQPGDKMAGRHGNKGVISRIIPVEDMPYLPDGTPIEIILNPLGVPSRMNVGQILETHLGWASAALGKKIALMLDNIHTENGIADLREQIKYSYNDLNAIEKINTLNDEELIELATNTSKGVPMASPVFDGAKEEDIVEVMNRAGVDSSGQTILIDGHTGEPFDRKVTVGYIYMLKLCHLVDDKIHARSIGPYSLVTQQPLGGKSHFGGQRFGEMECWALQAYGAAYTLQEMLTVKSDDVSGRIKIYESIVRGDYNFESGIPESFHVMIKELRSLCLNIELLQLNSSSNNE